MAILSMGPISSSPISSIPGQRVPQFNSINLDDTVGTVDLVSAVGTSAAVFNDPVSTSDGFTRVASYVRNFSDNVGTSDALTWVFARVRNPADAVVANDALTTFIARNRTIVDLASATDALTHASQYGRVFNDYAAATDSLGKYRVIYFNDTVTAVDDDLSTVPRKYFAEYVTATDAIQLNFTNSSVHLTAEPDLSYVADIATSYRYRLDAATSSHLFIDSVEEYSPEEARSPAHAT